MIRKALYQIVNEAESKKSAKDQAEVLKANASGPLKDVIGHALDPGVKWTLPEGTPPFKPFTEGENTEARLFADTRLFKYFVDPSLNELKREKVFIGLLESIHPDDAKLVIRIKDKTIKIKPEAAKIAFPGITKLWP